MFTHRICCCTAAVASQVVALVAILVVAGQAAFSWSYGNPLPLDIYQSVLVGIEILACVLVFVACCTTRAALVLPIIVMQVWNCLNVIGICGYTLYAMWYYGYDAYSYVFVVVFYLLGLLLSLFFLHCHICCYRLLVFKRIAHNHHSCAHDNYAA